VAIFRIGLCRLLCLQAPAELVALRSHFKVLSWDAARAVYSRKDKEMGEIKSTLELALKKTKHLTLSEQEKEEQKQSEIKA